MKERPILFSGEMIRAILDGSKSQTRRVVKPQPLTSKIAWGCIGGQGFGFIINGKIVRCPYGQPGDRLWVRETWRLFTSDDCACYDPCGCKVGEPIYRATYGCEDREQGDPPWRPSIFMRRHHSRITLEVTEVRVERVQEITEEDSRAEGITDGGCFRCGNPEPCGCSNPIPCARDSYAHLWNKINAKRGHSWESNPWVWVVSFKRIAT